MGFGGSVRSRLAVFVILLVAVIAGLLFARQLYIFKDLPRVQMQPKKLRVLTYSTFVGSTGPGNEILRRFESENKCSIEVVTPGDAGLLLERLKLGEAGVPFDVVIGLDQLMLDEAVGRFDWKDQVFASSGRHPTLAEFTHPKFVPIDWSPMSFVYRKDQGGPLPLSFSDLIKPEFKGQIALQDPRSSSPGLQFFHWVKALKGESTVEFLHSLRPNVNSVSPNWALSYGLFKKDQVRFVFSYLTSLAYHWAREGDRTYQVLSFPEGHPVQVEYAGVPETCRECELGQRLIEELLKPWAQKIIMEKNFMLPVIKGLEEGSVFGELPNLKVIKTSTGKDLSDWDKAFKP